jgi:hypothetical protein
MPSKKEKEKKKRSRSQIAEAARVNSDQEVRDEEEQIEGKGQYHEQETKKRKSAAVPGQFMQPKSKESAAHTQVKQIMKFWVRKEEDKDVDDVQVERSASVNDLKKKIISNMRTLQKFDRSSVMLTPLGADGKMGAVLDSRLTIADAELKDGMTIIVITEAAADSARSGETLHLFFCFLAHSLTHLLTY